MFLYVYGYFNNIYINKNVENTVLQTSTYSVSDIHDLVFLDLNRPCWAYLNTIGREYSQVCTFQVFSNGMVCL